MKRRHATAERRQLADGVRCVAGLPESAAVARDDLIAAGNGRITLLRTYTVAANTAPTATAVTVSLRPGESYSGQVQGYDAEGHLIRYGFSDPSIGSIGPFEFYTGRYTFHAPQASLVPDGGVVVTVDVGLTDGQGGGANVSNRFEISDGGGGGAMNAGFLVVLALFALSGCASITIGTPRVDLSEDLVLGCPQPIGASEPTQTIEGPGAVLALAEAMTLCDDALITHPEDREHQARLALQERLERIDRRRAREAAAEVRRAALASARDEVEPPR